MSKMLPLFKELAHKYWFFFSSYFGGSFANWSNGVTTTHLPHGFTTSNISPPTFFDNRWLGYVVFECHENRYIKRESFAHMDQQITCLGYVAPK